MKGPLARPPFWRRLSSRLRVVGIFLILLLVASAVAGFVQADNGDAPSTFGVPLPAVGDRGTYTVSVLRAADDAYERIEEDRPLLHFEWLTPRTIHDDEGLPHRVNELRVWSFESGHTENPALADVVYSFDVTTRELVASHHVASEGDGTGLGAYRRTFIHSEPDAHVVLCGLQNALQGRQAEIAGRTQLFRPCDYVDHWSPFGTFTARGRETVQGLDSVMFARGDAWFETGPRYYAWLAEEVPYPVRLAVERQDEANTYVVVRLTAFSRGTMPIDTEGGSPDGGPLPPMERASLEMHGVDASALALVFDVPDALEAATGHPDAGALRAYLDDHPDAVVVAARNDVVLGPGSDTLHSWHITVSDGVGGHSFHIEREMADVPEELAIGGQRVEIPGTEAPRITHRFMDLEPQGAGTPPYPGADAMPMSVPAVASLLEWRERYVTIAYAGLVPDALDFAFVCRDDACTDSYLRMSAGVRHVLIQDEADGTTTRTTETSLFEILEGWTDRSSHEYVESYRRQGFDASGLGSTGVNDGGGERVLAVDVGVWTFPNGYRLAGASISAALLALLYAFWPLLRNLPVLALFSRFEGRAVLDHSLRADMMATIEARPGIHQARLAAAVGRPRQTTAYHLGHLVRAGFVVPRVEGGYTCLFPVGCSDAWRLEHPALKADGARMLMAVLVETPDTSTAELARRSGLARGTVSYHARRLKAAGLVADRDATGVTAWRVTESGREVWLRTE